MIPSAGLGPMPAAFRWEDGDRVIVFGADAVSRLLGELGNEPYALITTPRAVEGPEGARLLAGAAARHDVAAGRVDAVAAEIRAAVGHELLVALGGGRVIDVAKALAAADPPRRVAAVPTTLSAAEMTRVHRHAAGVAATVERVRPAFVACDPALTASQPPAERAGSAANALAHAAEAPLTLLASPVPTLAALQATRLLAHASSGSGELDPDRRVALALGALLSGYAIDGAGYGLHHVLAQTLVRFAGLSHGRANAVMLPHTLGALRARASEAVARLDEAAGGDARELAVRLAERAGAVSLGKLGVDDDTLTACADEAAGRLELGLIPPAATRDELRRLYAAAS